MDDQMIKAQSKSMRTRMAPMIAPMINAMVGK